MTAKKLDFSMVYQGESRAVKARIFQGADGGTYATIDGGLFNDWEMSLDRLEQVIGILLDVRKAVRKGVHASST